MLLFCTASIPERGELVPGILEIDGVVSVQELVTGEQNILVTAVGESDDDITPLTQELLDMGITVADEVLEWNPTAAQADTAPEIPTAGTVADD